MRPGRWILPGLISFGFLFGQGFSVTRPVSEKTGVRYRNSVAKVSGWTIKNQTYCVGYEMVYSTRTTFGFYGGMNSTQIPSSQLGLSDFSGERSTYLEGRLKQTWGFIYLTSGVRRYKAPGLTSETKGNSVIHYDNVYTLWEFPVGIGLQETVNQTTLALGVSQTFLYGENQVGVKITSPGQTSNFGTIKQTFSDQQTLLYSGTLLIGILKNYTLGFTVETDGQATTLANFTFYTPVKK